MTEMALNQQNSLEIAGYDEPAAPTQPTLEQVYDELPDAAGAPAE
jgi:hypothetical protein